VALRRSGPRLPCPANVVWRATGERLAAVGQARVARREDARRIRAMHRTASENCRKGREFARRTPMRLNAFHRHLSRTEPVRREILRAPQESLGRRRPGIRELIANSCAALIGKRAKFKGTCWRECGRCTEPYQLCDALAPNQRLNDGRTGTFRAVCIFHLGYVRAHRAGHAPAGNP
jgi:hypothetical protein